MAIDKRSIKNTGEIVLERIVDMALLAIYFNLEAPSLVRSSKRYQISNKVDEDLEKYNYQSIKRAYSFLKRKGLIQVLKEADTLPKITKIGEEKLRRIIPFYDQKRTWDGQVYLVSYDIPLDKTKERHYLRDFLKKIGCGLLQKSVWVTPYNPTRLIKKFIEKHNLSGDLVLVSTIGKNGTIGGMTLSDLMEKVYNLNKLNLEYSMFIENLKNNNLNRKQLIFLYLSILKNDPQIPFPLLPVDWQGEKAYNYFVKFKNKQD